MRLGGQTENPAGGPPATARLSVWRRVAHCAATVRRRTPASDAWAARLGHVVAELDHLNRSTERSFLDIGGKLTGFMQTVQLLSSELSALADLLSGERGPCASEALTSALERSREMSASADQSNALLGTLHQEAGQLGQTLSGFRGALSTFHVIGVLTRVETARLGSAGADFGNLAGDVKLLAGDIQARIESALATAAQLIPPIESVLHRVSALEAGRAHDLPKVISGVLASLASFQDFRNRMHDASVRLAARYEAISAAFDNLVISIQFHDITRQQVEHVIAVLRQLISQPPPDAAAVRSLQSSQLANAGEKFSASAASITHSLDEIAGNVRQMSAESHTLSGCSDDHRDSFFLGLERSLGTLLVGFSGCTEAEAATRTASAGMADIIGRMHGSMEEIRTIEIQMQRMALNASIRAAQIGAPGDALGILAAAMQKLASESRQRSETTVGTLALMRQAAARLSHRESALDGERGNGDTASEGMRTALEDLHSFSERSFAQITQIVARGASLSEDVSAARDSFSAGALFADAIGRAQAVLQQVAGETQSVWPREGSPAPDPGLAEFAKLYTMQAERDVHRALAAGSGRSELSLPESSELGDDVELF